MSRGPAHCSEARRVRRELDAMLRDSAAATDVVLVWDAKDRVLLGLLADAIDRKHDLKAAYESLNSDPKLQVKVSAELRLIEAHISRLIKQIRTNVPKPESLRSVKARTAANARWARDAG